MADNRTCGNNGGREMVCIDTYRVLDSCRDKDCFENVRVFLTGYGQEIIDHTAAVRAKYARVKWAYIDVDSVPFNRGFYQLSIKIYVKIICEACIGPGNLQEFDGIAVVEKKVILFGSVGNVSIFKSEEGYSGFCRTYSKGCNISSNLPVAVVETVDPIILNSRVAEPDDTKFCCFCCADEIPEGVCQMVSGELTDGDGCNKLLVSLGLFSVIRIERPAQYLINAVEYCVPEKECILAEEEDPCRLFRSMAFPIGEFCPPSMAELNSENGRCDCK